MEKDKTNVWLVAIVAIVAIVSLTLIVISVAKGTAMRQTSNNKDSAGMAYSGLGENQQTEDLTSEEVSNYACSDNDGIDYYYSGTVNALVNGIEDSFSDYCVGQYSNTVAEYYCDGKFVAITHFDCPGGCIDGACVNYS